MSLKRDYPNELLIPLNQAKTEFLKVKVRPFEFGDFKSFQSEYLKSFSETQDHITSILDACYSIGKDLLIEIERGQIFITENDEQKDIMDLENWKEVFCKTYFDLVSSIGNYYKEYCSPRRPDAVGEEEVFFAPYAGSC
jgi:hypothetical protein